MAALPGWNSACDLLPGKRLTHTRKQMVLARRDAFGLYPSS
jgi:hypothetical protein